MKEIVVSQLITALKTQYTQITSNKKNIHHRYLPIYLFLVKLYIYKYLFQTNKCFSVLTVQ